MKPYFETKLGKLYNCDCLDFMKDIEEKSVDLVLTDPPYGLGFEYENFEDNQKNLISLIKQCMPQILRISKRCVLTCGHTNIWHYPQSKWIIAWVYGTTQQRNSWGFTSWQPVLCYGKDVYLANRKGARMDIIKDSKTPKFKNHPCPKPETFWRKLLERCSIMESDLVLDPFFGAGTTGLVCEETNRRWIGIEISEKYCEIAAKRISLEARQGKMF